MQYTSESTNYHKTRQFIKLDGIKTRFIYTPRFSSPTPRMIPFTSQFAWYID